MERFLNCSLNEKQLTRTNALGVSAHLIVIRRVLNGLIIEILVFVYASLAKGYLVRHAEGVNNHVMLVAIQYSSLLCIG